MPFQNQCTNSVCADYWTGTIELGPIELGPSLTKTKDYLGLEPTELGPSLKTKDYQGLGPNIVLFLGKIGINPSFPYNPLQGEKNRPTPTGRRIGCK